MILDRVILAIVGWVFAHLFYVPMLAATVLFLIAVPVVGWLALTVMAVFVLSYVGVIQQFSMALDKANANDPGPSGESG